MDIIVLSSYFQSMHATANGLCARVICRALREQGHHVRVVCYEAVGNTITEENVIEIAEKKDSLPSGNGMRARLCAYARTARDIFTPWYDRRLVKNYSNAVSSLLQQKMADMVVAMYFPLETVLAAAEVKKAYPHVQCVAFELDSAGDGISGGKVLDHIKERAFERRMETLYSGFSRIIVMKAHESYWKKMHATHLRKMAIADIPMIDLKAQRQAPSTADYYTGLYAGLLDSKHRNPAYFLKLLDGLNRDRCTLKVDFYSKGDCEHTLKTIESEHSYLKTHGYVAKAELDAASAQASCFISLGNRSSNSVPSKLFVYISTGKPIIHITSQANDVCTDYLSRYPLALVLHEEEPLAENIQRIKQFLGSCGQQMVESECIRQSYVENTPEYSANLILSLGNEE